MTFRVHTNKSALVALEYLNSTNDKLDKTQSRISTGLMISNAKDNAAVWSIAQDQRADIGALAAVKMSLDRATSIGAVSLTAGESVSDRLVLLKEKVVAAMDPSIDTNSRNALNSDYKSILRQITQVLNGATFDGANIVNGSLTSNIRFLANADASAFVTLSVKNMALSGSIITLAVASSIGSVTSVSTCSGDAPGWRPR